MRKNDLGLPRSSNLDQQSSIFLAPGTSFMEDNFFTDCGWGWFGDDSSTICFLCSLFRLLLYQLYLRPSGIRSWSLGTPNLDQMKIKIHSTKLCFFFTKYITLTITCLCMPFFLFCGEGNGNPLQCSCLENPRDGGAWWAAVYGIAQSQTRLQRLSSSSFLFCKACGGRGRIYFVEIYSHFLAQGLLHNWDPNKYLWHYWEMVRPKIPS